MTILYLCHCYITFDHLSLYVIVTLVTVTAVKVILYIVYTILCLSTSSNLNVTLVLLTAVALLLLQFQGKSLKHFGTQRLVAVSPGFKHAASRAWDYHERQSNTQANKHPVGEQLSPPFTSSCGKTNTLGTNHGRSTPLHLFLTKPDVFLSSKCLLVCLMPVCSFCHKIAHITITELRRRWCKYFHRAPSSLYKHMHITTSSA